jgi:tetratricopeptide (TPR) repeat protein
MNASFQYNILLWLLLLLPIIVAIYFYAVQQKKAVFKKLGDAHLVEELIKHYNKKSFPIKFSLLFFALALLIVSIANVRSINDGQKITRNGIDVMIALDVSKSMLAQDVAPNRLARAKQLLSTLIDKLSNDRVGIVIFAGKAYLQMPLTADHTAAKMYLAAASPQTVPTQGTVIGEALKSCYASFNNKEKKYKAVVLISDGEDHDDNAIDFAAEMAKNGVVINTVGIGSTEGSEILDENSNQPIVDKEGEVVTTKLNEAILAAVAEKGNGQYQLYTNAETVAANISNQLATLDKRTINDESITQFKSWFQYLLVVALLLLLIELFISENKKMRIPKMKAMVTLFFLSCSSMVFSQTEKTTIQNGNDAYKKSDFTKAINSYQEVVTKNETNATAQFNLGNALYKTGKKQEAAKAYEKAAALMTNKTEKSNALYNKAVTLQNDKKLPESIAAYKDALKQNPANEDARHNLQLVLKQQKEEQEQKKDNKNDKEKKDNKDEKNKKENKPKDDKKEDEKPEQGKSNISQKEAEQRLKALMQKEKDLQDKLHKQTSAVPEKRDKEW